MSKVPELPPPISSSQRRKRKDCHSPFSNDPENTEEKKEKKRTVMYPNRNFTTMAEIRERRITHYSSAHSILLVGEGDFSFSCCLALAFHSATNIVATSFDTREMLMEKYRNAYSNLAALELMGAKVLYGVDATRMRTHPNLQFWKFDRIIYNFPHAGFYGKEDSPNVILMHRNLVSGFLTNARSMLNYDGEIHVNHKIKAPFDSWRIEDLAAECSLLWVGHDHFRIEDYPGYQNKRGSCSRSDQPFPLGECRTFRFKLYPHLDASFPITERNFRIPVPCIPEQPPPNHVLTSRASCSNECRWIFGQYLDYVEETFGVTSNYEEVRDSVYEALRVGYEMYMGSGRHLSGYINILEELHGLTVLRSERLRQMLLGLNRAY